MHIFSVWVSFYTEVRIEDITRHCKWLKHRRYIFNPGVDLSNSYFLLFFLDSTAKWQETTGWSTSTRLFRYFLETQRIWTQCSMAMWWDSSTYSVPAKHGWPEAENSFIRVAVAEMTKPLAQKRTLSQASKSLRWSRNVTEESAWIPQHKFEHKRISFLTNGAWVKCL